jgi:hypothetical protein
VSPTPVWPARHPSKEDGRTLEKGTDVDPAPARDDAVTSDQRSASPPSPRALCGLPRRCATISSTTTPSPALWEPGTTRHHHTCHCTSSGLPSAAPSNQHTDGNQRGRRPRSHPRSRSWAGTGLATTLAGSEICQDNHQLHDALHHTTTHSLKTVRHDYKPPPLGL